MPEAEITSLQELARVLLTSKTQEQDILDVKDDEVFYHNGGLFVMRGIVREKSVGCRVLAIAKRVGNRIEFFENPDYTMISIYARVQSLHLRITKG